MVKKIWKNVLYLLCIIICLVSFTGCTLMENGESKNIQDKTNEEINYLEDQILTIVNKYAKGEYDNSSNNEESSEQDNSNTIQENSKNTLNWDEIEKSVNKINDIMDTIILDLSEVEISNDDLINFRNEVNRLSIAVSNRDEAVFLQETSILYSLLPTYLEKYSDDKNKINIMKLKSLVVSSFIYSNVQDWENAKNTIIMGENKYKEMMDDINYMREYSYNLNKVYILLEEFKTAIDQEQLELAKIKYINFIEKS